MIRLLIVDDDEINNFLLKHLLKKSSYPLEIKDFTNPVDAVAYIKDSHAGVKRVDLLLLDVNMPELTGWEVLNALRVNGESLMNGNKIYMLSSSVHSADLEQASQYKEVSGFISKPISLDVISRIFKEITDSNPELQ
jgi:CheY-like chemotaxis protein